MGESKADKPACSELIRYLMYIR